MSNESEPRCGNCTAWVSKPTLGRGMGHCCAGSPQVIVVGAKVHAAFPQTPWTVWCRQHKRARTNFEPPPEDNSGLPLPLPELTPEAIALKAVPSGSIMPGGGPNPRRVVSAELTNKGQPVPAGVVQSAAEAGESFRPRSLQQALAEKDKQ